MTLADLGYTAALEQHRKAQGLENFDVGRVIAEHKERYRVTTPVGEYEAKVIGNLRFTAASRADFPAVGDWVAISEYDTEKVLIHAILPRTTVIARKSAGKAGNKQLIAANVDCALIMQAVDRDFNINRLERYLTLCYEARVKPIIVLTKIDLIDEESLQALLLKIKQRAQQVEIIAISNTTHAGYQNLTIKIKQAKTYCLLGSSGVGKSTLSNNLSGNMHLKTGNISVQTQKGKHITSHRELIFIKNGGILIDNPGMREVGIADSASGLENTFEQIARLARQCHFKNCSHTSETGCAVIDALKNGDIDKNAYENYLKMEREQQHYSQTLTEKRQKDKDFGKMVKNFKRDIKKLNDKHRK